MFSLKYYNECIEQTDQCCKADLQANGRFATFGTCSCQLLVSVTNKNNESIKAYTEVKLFVKKFCVNGKINFGIVSMQNVKFSEISRKKLHKSFEKRQSAYDC